MNVTLMPPLDIRTILDQVFSVPIQLAPQEEACVTVYFLLHAGIFKNKREVIASTFAVMGTRVGEAYRWKSVSHPWLTLIRFRGVMSITSASPFKVVRATNAKVVDTIKSNPDTTKSNPITQLVFLPFSPMFMSPPPTTGTGNSTSNTLKMIVIPEHVYRYLRPIDGTDERLVRVCTTPV